MTRILAAGLALLAVTCRPGRQADVSPPSPGLEIAAAASASGGGVSIPGAWTRIEPGGETTCAHGTPYSFWVRREAADKLLIFLQGGGGCWSAETCRLGSEYFKDATGDFDDPSREPGIFDLENPENPFRDHSMVYVPYCTGDVHWGNKVHLYEGGDGSRVRIQHKGFVNAAAALKWTYEHFEDPEEVVVAGCSAGSIGSILFAAYAARHYERARLAQIGDSEAFVFSQSVDLDSIWGAHGNFPEWIPSLARMKPDEFTMARLYIAVAQSYPEHLFSQYNTAHDSVQIRYFVAAEDSTLDSRLGDRSLSPGVRGGDWERELDASLGEIHANTFNFRTYLAPGYEHCILPSPRFYSERASGVGFRDWVEDLVRGGPVVNVRCAACEELE